MIARRIAAGGDQRCAHRAANVAVRRAASTPAVLPLLLDVVGLMKSSRGCRPWTERYHLSAQPRGGRPAVGMLGTRSVAQWVWV